MSTTVLAVTVVVNQKTSCPTVYVGWCSYDNLVVTAATSRLTALDTPVTVVVMQSIQDRVAHLRRLSGRTAGGLSVAVGLSRGMIRLIEIGARQNVEAATVAAIAAGTGASADWLLTGRGEPPTEEEVRAALDGAPNE